MIECPASFSFLLLSTLALGACRGEALADPAANIGVAGAGAVASSDAPAPSAEAGLADLSDGFAVWESNRSGAWRIWTRRFGAAAAQRLSRDEPGRAHCCPHISPDGKRIAYLSLRQGDERYPAGGATGRLHLVRADGSEDHVLLPAAQTYFEHRAAVWHSDQELIIIDGSGKTLLVKAATGSAQTLVDQPGADGRGWLLDPTLRHATTGSPGFGRYDRAGRRVIPGPPLPGCQPFFSRDGRWGYWIAGAGGPIRRIDLASGASVNLLEKSDPRLPRDRGYLYFPMLAPSGSLFAWAASDGTHDHQRADYDIFVAESDPQTLEIVGTALRLTEHPATDRFPDVFVAPLDLGRHFGEQPLKVTLRAPPGIWNWRLSEGETARGQAVEHVFDRIGTYRIQATKDGETLHGLVRVRQRRPPAVVATEVTAARSIAVRFDEAIDATEAQVRFTSGRTVLAAEPAGEQRLDIMLTADFEGPDTLVVSGVRDRASPPNIMPETRLEIRAPAWPSRRDGLVLLWQSAKSPNQVTAPASIGPHRSIFEQEGRAFTNRDGAMVLAGGLFLADMPTMEGLLAGLRATNALSLEMTITPSARSGPSSVLGRIFSFSGGLGRRNLTLSERGDELVLQINTPETGKNAEPGLTLGSVERGRPNHVVVAYEPGRVTFYVGGEPKRDVRVATGGFFHWRPLPLLIGGEWQAERPWHGRVEGVAIYNRVLDAHEVRESARRYAALLASRVRPERRRVVAVLEAASAVPSLESIAPYRDALAVFAYRVEPLAEGNAPAEIRVVHRVLLGGDRIDTASLTPGARRELVLEPFAAHPELASLYRSETLPPRYEMPLYYALTPAER